MKSDKIKSRISEIASHFTFEYRGKKAGVDPFSKNDFDMWFGDNDKKATSIEEVMNDKFFDGKSLTEIAEEIKIIDW